MRTWAVLLCPLASLAMLLASCGRPSEHASGTATRTERGTGAVRQLGEPEGGRAAAPVAPDPRVGAIFPDSGAMHICTGAVLHSKGGDLVLTAAHCLHADARTGFVPGFSGEAAPTDMWTVGDVYFDARWLDTRDPHADFAIARVSGPSGSVEARAGSGLSLGRGPEPGTRVAVTGYPAGVGGQPLGCQASTGITAAGFPSLACEGLVGGTSGAPWITGSTVVGLIGGFEGGGCTENISYSSPFGAQVGALLARAEAGGPGDTAPMDFDFSCQP